MSCSAIICALTRINIRFKDFPAASYKNPVFFSKVFNNAIKTVLDAVQTLNAV